MTPDMLSRYATVLYGSQWQTQMAHALGVSDRTVRRWTAGTHAIPDGLLVDVRGLLRDRAAAIADMLAD